MSIVCVSYEIQLLAFKPTGKHLYSSSVSFDSIARLFLRGGRDDSGAETVGGSTTKGKECCI